MENLEKKIEKPKANIEQKQKPNWSQLVRSEIFGSIEELNCSKCRSHRTNRESRLHQIKIDRFKVIFVWKTRQPKYLARYQAKLNPMVGHPVPTNLDV